MTLVLLDTNSMHQLAEEFELHKSVWHGHELLHKMFSARLINTQLVKEIYEALERNNDLPKTWEEVKHTTFRKVFGRVRT